MHKRARYSHSMVTVAPWDELDEELVGEIARHSDRAMWSPMEHVCRKWRRAIVAARATSGRWSPAAWFVHSITTRQARGVDAIEPHFVARRWHESAVSSGRWRWNYTVARNGWLSLLKWAHALDRLCPESAADEAASTGNLPLLAWLASVGACVNKGALYYAAAAAGHVHALEWLYEAGHRPKCAYTCEPPLEPDNSPPSNAAKNHLDILAWAHSNGCPRHNDHVLGGLAKGGHLAILQWLIASGYQCSKDVANGAAEGGHLHVLEWARTMGRRWDAWTCAAAAGAGHLEILKWLRANGCPWDGLTCRDAAKEGHLEVVRWARAHGCPWDEHTCASVAATGRLDVLQWLRDQGCPWSADTCTEAAHKGHLHILDWAVKNGCPWSPVTCLSDARRRDQHRVIMWIVDMRDGITPRHLPGLPDPTT
ncbi:hypothetical protein pclt_cds_744 [Pandoravirus celtis]|uniref:Ankyrin repeat domain containing protein n=1 Tax=Pandoravirus celtis TaxID=2568002 RepID=A0A4D6EIS4_9VIRU|nr:hypothetical protein pclt_cds_744 [Pandoravirus celtis]